jgi:hypothetical protein
MKRLLPLVALFCALLLPPFARAAESAWHSEQPVEPSLGVPVALGEIGSMSFWAPNRGALITSGNGGMPAGVYAYDGTGWYLYSTVCGGHEGSIAWSGPDEFWTVSDYAEAQEGSKSSAQEEQRRTLCQFKDGEVVASYAEPLSSPAAYPQMTAAACSGPADCWFAGERLPEKAVNKGVFHLFWNGASLTGVPSATAIEPRLEDLPGSVLNLAFFQGRLLETATKAPYLREVSLADPRRFLPVELPSATESPLAFLSADPEQDQLWIAGPEGAVLRQGFFGLEEVPVDTSELFTEIGLFGLVTAVAAEPGSEAAWLGGGGNSAQIRRIEKDGTLGPLVSLPQPGEELSPKGPANQLVCPAPGQCWLATSKGWLFHLGGPLPNNGDPALHKLINFRPKDDSTRSFIPAGVPVNDSGEVEPSAFGEPVYREPVLKPKPAKALVTGVHQKVLHKKVLELSFVLHARAHVRLRALRHKKVVATTPLLTLASGLHKLKLRLNPKHWPTRLDFQVHPAGQKAS